MKYIAGFVLSIICITAALATSIEMFGQEKYGFNQPRYVLKLERKPRGNPLNITALAQEDNFPFSSIEQGSVFYKVFENILEEGNTKITLEFTPGKYEETALDFERNKNKEVNALFGVYYKEQPFYENKYVYPALAFNNVHLIMSSFKKIDIASKKDLKNYKGIHAATDKVSDIVARDFKNLNIKEVADFPTAFEELLTGQADYIVASYYPSLIAAYKLGIKRYIIYSKTSIWKMPIFLRVTPQVMRNPNMKNLIAYLKSSEYKKIRNEAFEELIEIYKKNTAGIVPPTYKKAALPAEEASSSSDENNINSEDNQTE